MKNSAETLKITIHSLNISIFAFQSKILIYHPLVWQVMLRNTIMTDKIKSTDTYCRSVPCQAHPENYTRSI